MAQQTEVEAAAKPPSEVSRTSETRSAAPPPAERKSFFEERPNARLFLIGVVLVLIVGGFFGWRYLASYENTDDAAIDGHLMPLSARISGYVSGVNVNDNQYVSAGTVLVEIDPKDYQVALEKAQAGLADAQATAQSMNIDVPIASVNASSGVSSSEADVQNAEAGISYARQQSDAAAAQLAQEKALESKAQQDIVRYKQLVDKQEVSQQTYDQAVATAKSTAAAVAGAQSQVTAAEQQVAQAQAKLLSAQAALRNSQTGPQQVASTRAKALSALANVDLKKTDVEQAGINLQYTRIIAPVSGIVTKNVEVGMNVSPGQQLVTVVPLDDIWVTANFKETQLKNMRPGQAVNIYVDANGRTYKGHVDSVSGSSGARLSLLPPENATGNYVKIVQRVPVKIVFDPGQDDDHYLRLGMSVEPKVFLK
jgi:membrane fusion protein (multidrug efflux system)